MPALDDDREERFAQELAKGAVQAVAYVNAGYPAKNSRVAASAANRLLKNKPSINERTTELKSLARTDQYNAAFVVNLDTMTALYMEDRAHAKALGQVGAAISALGGVAKLHGLGSETVRNPDMADTLSKFLEAVSTQPRLGK